MIAIFAHGTFSRRKNEIQKKILETIESELMPMIPKMEIQEVLVLLDTYCLFQRYPSGEQNQN